jgi:hypothetical protein
VGEPVSDDLRFRIHRKTVTGRERGVARLLAQLKNYQNCPKTTTMIKVRDKLTEKSDVDVVIKQFNRGQL